MSLKFVKILLSGIFCLLFFALNAQNIDVLKADRANYIWGEGTGNTLKEADQQALSDIISQITTQVENSFEKVVTESGDQFSEKVSDVIKTYSNATLKNTERIVIQNEPDAKVFRYIKRAEILKVFESRKNKILEFTKNAVIAQENYQITDALRYFYWAQTLLRSHPESGEIRFTYKDFKDELLISWIPAQINQIFSNIKISVKDIVKEDNYTNYILETTYNGNATRNLDYSYWTGQDWSNIYSSRDGIGIIELQQQTVDLRLKLEYAFEGEANIDLELRDVIQKVPPVPYKSSYINISTKIAKVENKQVMLQVAAQNPVVQTNSVSVRDLVKTSSKIDPTLPAIKIDTAVASPKNSDTERNIMQTVIKAIQTKQFASVKANFTTEGFDIFTKLLDYGHAKILKSDNLKFISYNDMLICRSLTMSFSFQNNNKVFVEDVVFYFDKESKISNISFGLSQKSIEDIISKPWSENTLMLLINFMENYKTAYALKRLDFIEKIFSDDALIITGSVLKAQPNSAEFKYANNPIVKYNKMSKSAYLKNLEHCFKSNEFINIRFADNTVKQAGKKNEYFGIQIKQDYYSTNYGDSGYLFLLIDMTDTISPQIQVRTWQPEKNADGSVYGLEDFTF